MTSGVKIWGENGVGRILLDRPAALNALTDTMVVSMLDTLRAWRADDSIKLVLIEGAGEKAFCAGGDVQQLYRNGRNGEFDKSRGFFATEYRLNALIASYPKPYVAIMDRIVMGGGIGISAHGSHRIVTERSTLALPECTIGLIPDVGSNYLLAKAPGRIGEYLALTGARMSAADAIYAGFADYYVPSASIPALVENLLQAGDAAQIENFAQEPPNSMLAQLQCSVDAVFSGGSVSSISRALTQAPLGALATAAAALKVGSPLSLCCALATLRAVRAEGTVGAALCREYRFVGRAAEQGDFLEGVRAALIDKDRKPNWGAKSLEDVDGALIERLVAPLGEQELDLSA